MKTIIKVELEIDVDTQEELQEVLDNMDYNFSYLRLHDDYTGNGMSEIEYIKNYEIIS